MPRSPQQDLTDLLASLFSEDELRRFVGMMSPGLERELPGRTTSLATLACESAALLARHGLVTGPLFDDLTRQRPARASEIADLRRLYPDSPPGEGREVVVLPLSRREREVLSWLRHGKGNWEISRILGISERTVKFHVTSIMRKLNAVTRTQAVALAMELGVLEEPSGAQPPDSSI